MRSRCWNTGFHRAAIFATLVAIGGMPAAQAADPVAIVEEVTAAKPTVQFMDYVASGTVIRLRPSDSLVLGYVRSCWRETIRGGVVRVGTLQSTVIGGDVTRERVECDGGRMRLSPAQAGSAGAMVFRGIAKPVNLYAQSPVFVLDGDGLLVINRTDKTEDPIKRIVRARPPSRIAIYDMVNDGGALAPGGKYQATWSAESVDFTIDPDAAAGDAPIIGRVIRLKRNPPDAAKLTLAPPRP